MEHVISVLVENRPGVLAHIAGMFSQRGYNIDSLAVGETMDSTLSRITVVARGDDRVIGQIIKQLGKIVDVVRIVDLAEKQHVSRELVLVKVACDNKNRPEIMQLCDIFRARIIDVGHTSLVIEVVGEPGKISALVELFKPFGILEICRTGRVGVFRGEKILKSRND